jgi:hypothetical protein
MRRDVVRLGVALAVGGLAYGAYRAAAPGPRPVAPVAVVAETLPARAVSPTRASHRARTAVTAPKPAPIHGHERLAAIAAHVRTAAARQGVPESLVAAVISVESEFNPRAISPRGALGLMQLMPSTAVLLGVRNAFDPHENIDAGAKHLRDLLDRFSDTHLALAAYNAGPQAVIRHGGVPPYPETRQFVARVMSRMSSVMMPAVAVAAAASPAGSPLVRMARLTPERLRGRFDEGVVQVVLSEETSATVAAPAVPAPPPMRVARESSATSVAVIVEAP